MAEFLKTTFLFGLGSSEVEAKVDARDKRASAELDWRERITGSEMVAKADCVLSKAAASRLRRLLLEH